MNFTVYRPHRAHCWGADGKCKYCSAERCCGKVVQFRRGKPHEMRCKARAFKMGFCTRCDERARRAVESESA